MAEIVETRRLNAEALFDSLGPAYEVAFATCMPQQESVDWLVKQLPPNSSVLDIGCGTGRPVCSTLIAAGHSVFGIDVSGVMIEAASRNLPGAQFQKADIKSFTPPAGTTYDAITVYFSLIASVTQQEIKDVFAKAHSWLKPGGYFVFATLPLSTETADIEWVGKPITISSLSENEIVEGLKELGFQVLNVQNSKFVPRFVEAGICGENEAWEESHVFVHARK